MKTKYQLDTYFKVYKVATHDWPAVKRFIFEKTGCVYTKRGNGSKICSYDCFTKWYDNGIGVFDVVEVGRTVGVVVRHTDQETALCAVEAPNGEVVIRSNDNPLIVSNDKVRFMDEDHQQAVRLSFKKQNVFVDKYNGKISENPPLNQNNLYVNSSGFYMVKEVTEDTIECYFYWNGKVLVENQNISGDTELYSISKKETESVLSDIEKLTGRIWFMPNKCFISYTSRVPINQKYYYLTDKFSVTSAKDTYSPLHTARYKAGNYFEFLKDALEFIKSIKALRFK